MLILLFSVGTVADFALAPAIGVVAIVIPFIGVALVVADDVAEVEIVVRGLNIAIHRTTGCVNPNICFYLQGDDLDL